MTAEPELKPTNEAPVPGEVRPAVPEGLWAVGTSPDAERPAGGGTIPISAAPRAGGQLRAAVLEAGLVVFGVVLAFAANEWREQRASERRAEHAITGILEELRANRIAVATSLEYHEGLLRAVSDATRGGAAPGIETFSRGFVMPASVYRTAWDSASATGALETVDFATLLQLSRVYAQQDRYEQQSGHIAPLIYGELYRGGRAAILANHRNLASLIGAMAYRERELLAVCDEALAEVGAVADG